MKFSIKDFFSKCDQIYRIKVETIKKTGEWCLTLKSTFIFNYN